MTAAKAPPSSLPVRLIEDVVGVFDVFQQEAWVTIVIAWHASVQGVEAFFALSVPLLVVGDTGATTGTSESVIAFLVFVFLAANGGTQVLAKRGIMLIVNNVPAVSTSAASLSFRREQLKGCRFWLGIGTILHGITFALSVSLFVVLWGAGYRNGAVFGSTLSVILLSCAGFLAELTLWGMVRGHAKTEIYVRKMLEVYGFSLLDVKVEVSKAKGSRAGFIWINVVDKEEQNLQASLLQQQDEAPTTPTGETKTASDQEQALKDVAEAGIV